MNLDRFINWDKANKMTSSKSLNNDRYLIDFIFNDYILTNDRYKGITLLNYGLNVIRSFKTNDKFIATHSYFSDDRIHFLAYNAGYHHLYYINLLKPEFEPIKIDLIEDVILYPEYLWENDKFIIATDEKMFFCYDILKDNSYTLTQEINKEQELIFKKLKTYGLEYRLLSYNFKEEIFIYRDKNESKSRIYWKNIYKNIDVDFISPLDSVYQASCVDDLLALVNDEAVVFFNLEKEIHRINVRGNYVSCGARLYKNKGKIYFLLLSSNINDHEDTIIDLYHLNHNNYLQC